MENNKNLPAFPVLELKQMGDKLLLDCTAAGVSKLEFFACNAPNEIPGWFKNTPPEMDVTPRPSCSEMEDGDQQLIRAWHDSNDVLGDSLPNHLKWYATQFTLHTMEQAEYNELDRIARYFQWRRYYAENLLAELSKS